MRRALPAVLLALLATPPAPEDEAAIVSAVSGVLDRQEADWNRHDLEGFLQTYWKSDRLVFQSGGEKTAGWEAIRERYRKRYLGEGREMGKLDFREREVIPLGPDAALARGRWRLTLADGSTPGGLFTLVVRRLPEGWRIVHDHTSSAPL